MLQAELASFPHDPATLRAPSGIAPDYPEPQIHSEFFHLLLQSSILGFKRFIVFTDCLEFFHRSENFIFQMTESFQARRFPLWFAIAHIDLNPTP
jgi:hypothetical protein